MGLFKNALQHKRLCVHSFSMIWGAACVVIVKFFHPALYKILSLIPTGNRMDYSGRLVHWTDCRYLYNGFRNFEMEPADEQRGRYRRETSNCPTRLGAISIIM